MSVLRTVLDKLSASPSYQFNSRIVNILGPQRPGIIEKLLQKREATLSDDVLPIVDVVFA